MKLDKFEFFGSLIPFSVAMTFAIYLGETTALSLFEAIAGVFGTFFGIGFLANLYLHMKEPDDYFWTGVFRCTYATIIFLAFWGTIAAIAGFLIGA